MVHYKIPITEIILCCYLLPQNLTNFCLKQVYVVEFHRILMISLLQVPFVPKAIIRLPFSFTLMFLA